MMIIAMTTFMISNNDDHWDDNFVDQQ